MSKVSGRSGTQFLRFFIAFHYWTYKGNCTILLTLKCLACFYWLNDIYLSDWGEVSSRIFGAFSAIFHYWTYMGMYNFAHFKLFGIFENLMLFVPFLFHPVTSNQGLPYWTMHIGQIMRRSAEIRLPQGNAFAGSQKWWKIDDFYARFKEGIWVAMHFLHRFSILLQLYIRHFVSLHASESHTPNSLQCPGIVFWVFWHFETRTLDTFKHDQCIFGTSLEAR